MTGRRPLCFGEPLHCCELSERETASESIIDTKFRGDVPRRQSRKNSLPFLSLAPNRELSLPESLLSRGAPPVRLEQELFVQNQRKRVWIDHYQTRLTARILFYIIAYQVALWAVLFAVQIFWNGMETAGGQSVSPRFGLMALLVLIALLLVMTMDAVRYLHRLVGPIYRFRKTIQAIAEGDPIDKVKLRKNDFLKEFMVDINEMIDYLESKGAVVIKSNQPAEEQVAAGS